MWSVHACLNTLRTVCWAFEEDPLLKSASLSTCRFAAYAYFSRSLDEETLTIIREIAPVHAKPAGFTAIRWSQGSTLRKYAAHDTCSSILLVHTRRQTELTKEGRSKWRFWPLQPVISCTRDGTDWPKVVAVGAHQPISDFFWLYSNARHTINKRRTSPGCWSQEISSHTKINEICQRKRKWRQLKKVVSLAGLHHRYILNAVSAICTKTARKQRTDFNELGPRVQAASNELTKNTSQRYANSATLAAGLSVTNA